MPHENTDSCFQTGAAWGGAFGFLSSEAPQNFLRGDGFMINQEVYDRMFAGVNSNEKAQELIHRFTFQEGIFDPTLSDLAHIIQRNGEFVVKDGPDALRHGYDQFRMISRKEFLSMQILFKDPASFPDLPQEYKFWNHEFNAFTQLDRNFGLFTGAERSIISKRINVARYPLNEFYGKSIPEYNRPWWDFIYRIPRRY